MLRILAGLIYRVMRLVVKQAREGKVVKPGDNSKTSLSLSLSEWILKRDLHFRYNDEILSNLVIISLKSLHFFARIYYFNSKLLTVSEVLKVNM